MGAGGGGIWGMEGGGSSCEAQKCKVAIRNDTRGGGGGEQIPPPHPSQIRNQYPRIVEV